MKDLRRTTGLHLVIRAAALSAATLALPTPALAFGPSFDCNKATRQIDRAICAWGDVGMLDGRMAAAYQAAMISQPNAAALMAARAQQRAWLAERDQRCSLANVQPLAAKKRSTLSPQELGQRLCLQTLYPPQIARLVNLAAPALMPQEIQNLPITPLKAAYPDTWRQLGYQAGFSPDKTLIALGVEDDAGYVIQIWLYRIADERMAVASPLIPPGTPKAPEDIGAFAPWVWGQDGLLYVQARRPYGKDSLFGADMEGYAEQSAPPPDIARQLAGDDSASALMPGDSAAPRNQSLPGLDDDSRNEQRGGAITAWAQDKGHGSFELRTARPDDGAPRIIATGGWELADFLLDPEGKRLFYSSENGIMVADPGTGATRRLDGTRGTPSKARLITLSADGETLLYSARAACNSDATEEQSPQEAANQETRLCLARLPLAAGHP